MISALGLRLVLRDPVRGGVAAAGIAVAVLIVFVEMGFLNGVIDSHLRMLDAVHGDLVVIDKRRSNLNRWDGFLAIRVNQIAAIDGVASVTPVYQSADSFRSAPGQSDHRINIMAFPPEDPPFALEWTPENLALLRQPGAVLMDRLSRSIYGDIAPGQDVWIEGRRMRLAGFVALGPTMVVDGMIVMSEGSFRAMKPGAGPKMAVVRLAPGAESAQVRARIAAALGPDVSVYAKSGLSARESAYLMRVAPLGLLFGAGMIAGLFVGLVICYQVLYIAVRRRLKAYATVKAMGFGNGFILGTILQQAFVIAIAGYAAGLVLSVGAYYLLERSTGLLIQLTWLRAGSVGVGCLIACALAGTLASIKAVRVAPAELF